MNTTATLRLSFTSNQGKRCSIAIREPKENLTGEQVKQAMEAMIAAKALGKIDNDGNLHTYEQMNGADYITRQVKTLF